MTDRVHRIDRIRTLLAAPGYLTPPSLVTAIDQLTEDTPPTAAWAQFTPEGTGGNGTWASTWLSGGHLIHVSAVLTDSRMELAGNRTATVSASSFIRAVRSIEQIIVGGVHPYYDAEAGNWTSTPETLTLTLRFRGGEQLTHTGERVPKAGPDRQLEQFIRDVRKAWLAV